MANRKKKTSNSSLSAQKVAMDNEEIDALNQKVFSAINSIELQKSMDKWLKQNNEQNNIVRRDMSVLKRQVSEYLDSFLIFGYNLEGDRIIIQHFKNAKDRDAVMEFFKTIFLKQQHENFLDE
jgi:hypothetical protein